MGKRKKKGRSTRSRAGRSEFTPIQKRAAAALMDQSKDRQVRLREATEDLRKEMEERSLKVRDLILLQPPIQLLGYMQSQLHMGFATTPHEDEIKARQEHKELIKTFQFALEYLHAVWSCHASLPADKTTAFNEEKVGELFQALEDLEKTTAMYCMVSTSSSDDSGKRRASSETEFQAKFTWTLIRGNRYQVLEQEFFQFVLQPHDDALRAVYGIGAIDIAAEMQAITDSMRAGFSQAVEAIRDGMEATSPRFQ